MNHNSKMLITLWQSLETIEREIMDKALPAAGYCGMEDAELLSALETAAYAIAKHFKAHVLYSK